MQYYKMAKKVKLRDKIISQNKMQFESLSLKYVCSEVQLVVRDACLPYLDLYNNK